MLLNLKRFIRFFVGPEKFVDERALTATSFNPSFYIGSVVLQ